MFEIDRIDFGTAQTIGRQQQFACTMLTLAGFVPEVGVECEFDKRKNVHTQRQSVEFSNEKSEISRRQISRQNTDEHTAEYWQNGRPTAAACTRTTDNKNENQNVKCEIDLFLSHDTIVFSFRFDRDDSMQFVAWSGMIPSRLRLNAIKISENINLHEKIIITDQVKRRRCITDYTDFQTICVAELNIPVVN